MSLIAISVTSCCVALSLQSRDCQTGSESSKCEPSKRTARRANGDDDDDDEAAAVHFCQMNCDSSSTLERSSTRRTRVPPVPPAPVNHVDQSQRYLHHHKQTYSDAGDSVDRRRASPANSLLLSRSNSRSNIRPSSVVGCAVSSASYLPMGRAGACLRSSSSSKTMDDGRHRLERLERCVDMFLFVLLVLICVGLAVCLVFMFF